MPAMSRLLSCPIGRLRIISITEAISYLILLGIAMPLKYIWGDPTSVRIVGMIHGVLFCIFCAALLNAKLSQKWKLLPPFWIFMASLVPFAPIWVEIWLKKQMAPGK
jgi:integral membrane protein